MNKQDKTELNRQLMKETPRIELEYLIDRACCTEIEHNIAVSRLLDKRTPLEICMRLNISQSTYYRCYRDILIKISKIKNN